MGGAIMAGKRIVALGLFALVALTIGLFAASGTEAQSYKPTNTFTVASNVGGAVSNNTQIVRIAAPDYNYEDSSMYSFTPIDWWTPPSAAIPMYAGVGVLSSTATIGTFNGKCATDAPPVFTLYNASVAIHQQLTPAEMAWTNTLNPIPTGTYVAGVKDYLARYPHFLNLMLDPDGPHGPLLPLKPRARYAGDAEVAGSNMLIELVILSPGQIAQLPGIKTQMVAGMGYVFLTMLNNPVDQAEKPGSVSDFCTSLMSNTLLYGVTTNNPATAADESGFTATKNPPSDSGVLGSGTHIQRNFSQSERDVDGDGWENDFDPCPFTPDPLWQPRLTCTHIGPGDHDCDGLPDSCDPTPEDNTNVGDHDFDGYNNRQDICPLVANGCKDANCSSGTYNAIWDNQSDEDGKVGNADLGPSPDSIGDACDDSDGDTIKDAVELGQCRNDTDDDTADDDPGYPVNPALYGKWINDGCPVKGTTSEATISGACDAYDKVDNDADTRVNDGCATKGATAEAAGAADGAEATIWGTNPGTGLYYQGMTWAAVTINSATDSDGDGYSDSLETQLGSPAANGGEYELTPATSCPADANCCNNNSDDDGDTLVNDGCPQVGDYAERGTECAPGNNVSDDTAGVLGAPDNRLMKGEVALGEKVNDGCPAGGVPESLVIDAVINAPLANPAGDATKSCNDGLDNDGDTTADLADNTTLGCNPAHASYTGDTDKDGVPDAAPDNCPTLWNPEQTNTDAALRAAGAQFPVGTPLPLDTPLALGDVCDPDDDNDTVTDVLEWYMGTDPIDNCPNAQGANSSDAWPLDQNKDKSVTTVGDVLKYRGNIGASITASPPTSWSLARLDLNGDKSITTVGDVLKYRGNIGIGCT
jgi:hypothetical protein